MPLVEVLVVDVGASIAKAILKRWLNNSALLSDATASAVDILKTYTTDRIAQQRAQRQFEAIGEKVGESLLPIFEMEGARLDEGARTAVALAVADALNAATSEVLAQHNLEPVNLAKYLLGYHPARSYHFSDDEGQLYERIVTESCTYIVDIASQLPLFTERTLAEILKREGQLITIAEKILQEVARMRAQLDPHLEAARFELDYRRAVVRHLDEMELFGSGMSVTSRKYSLSLAYITLSLEQKVDYIHQPTDECTDASSPFSSKIAFSSSRLPDSDMALQKEEAVSKSTRRIISVDELLSDTQCVLIRGDAGSGKTTLLQWIAVQSASQTFSQQLRTWNATVPFYIRLRQHVPVDLVTTPAWPAPEAFPYLVASAIAGSMPHGWVHQKLKNGHAIVLVDGIDEVPPSQRESVHVWLKDLVEAYPQTRFVVTSRPYAIEEGGLSAEGFKDARLQPMELPDIETFIDQWHKAIAANVQDHEEQALTHEAAERLKGEMRHNRAQRTLATNPLLCAMLCALNRERHQQLPSDRIALYEACCELLIERRDAERRISLTEYPAAMLSYAQKSLLLADLAYWFVRNGWSEAPLQKVDERFDWRLALAREALQKFRGTDARLLFVQRSGIIREPVAGSIDFAHRTFQEFLAAKAIVDEADIGVLVQHAHDDQWREVALLAAGLASKKVREDLVEQLIGRGETEKGYRSQLYILAAACAESSHEKVGLNTKLRVERHLGVLVPLRNVKEVEALAAAGELAIPYLYPHTQYQANVAAACVRILTRIGSEAALKVLTEYTNDLTPQVIEAMIAGLQNIEDKQTYAQHYLSHIKEAQLSSLTSLEDLQYLPQFSSLHLEYLYEVSDLAVLERLPQLSSLHLHYLPQVSDLAVLERLPQLSSLHLEYLPQVSDLAVLERLPQLSSLHLYDLPQVSDLAVLERLPQLSSLTLRDLPQVSDLAVLERLPQLSSLHLQSLPQVSALAVLERLPQLSFLTLRDLPQVSALAVLERLPQLSSLHLEYLPQVSALAVLERLPQLSSLTLRDLPQVSDLAVLERLPQLSSLHLEYLYEVSDLAVLERLPQLSSLTLRDLPQVSALAVLERLPQLSSLHLEYLPQVSDLAVLERLPQLSSLHLEYLYEVSALAVLERLPQLSSLHLQNLPKLTDLAVLERLPQLSSLTLRDLPNMHNLGVLAYLTHLTKLVLDRDVHIQDLNMLVHLRNLKHVELDSFFHDITLPQEIKEIVRIRR